MQSTLGGSARSALWRLPWLVLLVTSMGQLGCDAISGLFPPAHEQRAAKAIPTQTNQLVEGSIVARSTRVHSFTLEKAADVRVFVTGVYHPDLWLYRAGDDALVAEYGYYRQEKRAFDASIEKRLEPGEYQVVTDGYPNESTRRYLLVIMEEPESGADASAAPLTVGSRWSGQLRCKETTSRNALNAKVVLTINAVKGRRVEGVAQFWPGEGQGEFMLRGMWSEGERRLVLLPTQWTKQVHWDWFGIAAELDEEGRRLKGRIISAHAAETSLVKRPCADVVLQQE